MEFTVINNVEEKEFKRVIKYMVGEKFEHKFTFGKIKQSYDCSPLLISLNSRPGYIKVYTGLENGWPFLEYVIEKNKYTAMSIRYHENEIAEFKYWANGILIRMQHALKGTMWVWYGEGEIQTWEEPSKYDDAIIKNRLTCKMLESYLKKCGYEENFT